MRRVIVTFGKLVRALIVVAFSPPAFAVGLVAGAMRIGFLSGIIVMEDYAEEAHHSQQASEKAKQEPASAAAP